nr:nucleoside hydrolase [Egibacter rhizosphaerae]
MHFDDEDLAALTASGDPAAAFAAGILPHYLDVAASRTGQRRCALHDPLAVAAAVDPSVVTTEALPVRVETAGGWTRGMTVVDLRSRRGGSAAGDAPLTDVALGVEAEPVRAMLHARLASSAVQQHDRGALA